MRRSTFRQLQIFEAIARHMSFTRAAEELFLTQPTVSTQMKKLTDNIGTPQFERVGTQLYLTDAGKELVHTCSEIFSELDRYEMTVANLQGLKKGKLRITIVTTAKYFVPSLLGTFCQKYPGVEASLNVTNREQAFSRLDENLDDLYVLGQPPKDMHVESQPFLENPLVVLAPANHPLANEKNITFNRFAQEPFLVREPGSGTRNVVNNLFDKHGLKLNVRMELGSNEAIKQAVIGGLGVSVLSRHALSQDPRANELSILDVQGFPILRHWYVVYPVGKQLSLIASTFLEFLHQSEH